MYEYHVTYGAFKKIVKSESNIAKHIHHPIKKSFILDPNCSLHLQYWHAKHNDWVDCEDCDEINEDTKLNVWQNVLDQQLNPSFLPTPSPSNVQQLDSSSLPPSPSNERIRSSTPINSTSSTVFEGCSLTDGNQQMNPEDFPYVYQLPQFPLWVQTLLDTRSPLCKEAKCRRGVLDALFDDLLRYGCYPKSRVFQETSRALVEAYPILKDKQFANAQPHDSWVLRLRDKFKKYRSRHAELCNAEELNRMKAKFGMKRDGIGLDMNNGLDDSLTTVKRMKVSQFNECAEDQFSINIHIKLLQEECRKRKPDNDLIRDKMMRTFQYRAMYVTTHSVAETLICFPPLQQTNELLNEAKRLGTSESILREFLSMKNTILSELVQKRKQKNKRLSQLLTEQAECACTEDSELAFLFLVLPCLMQEMFPLLYAEENAEISVLQPMIVYRSSRNVLNNSCYELFLDKQLVTKAEDLVTAATLWFSLFWLFDVGYSKNHLKLLSFLDTFVFKKCSLPSVPRSVKSFFNVI